MPIDHKEGTTLFFQREQYALGGVGRWYWDFKDGVILKLIKPKHQEVIDIGCGEGILLEKLIKIFPSKKIRGIDVLPQNVEICRKFQLPVSIGSVYDLQMLVNCLDLCIFAEVIEHLENPGLALDNIKESLKKNGEVIILFPNDRIFKIIRLLFLKFKEAFADLGHIQQFNPGLIKKMLKERGFEIIKVKNIPFCSWFFSLHGLVVARKL
jgi:2-polyprenyl-3-methyl-5-hydroxy-6-metoxy-1,4-benzoquinol methylase